MKDRLFCYIISKNILYNLYLIAGNLKLPTTYAKANCKNCFMLLIKNEKCFVY